MISVALPRKKPVTSSWTSTQQKNIRETLRYFDERIGRKQLAAALGIATQTVSNLTQKQPASLRIAEALAELAGLTLKQLLAGERPRRCPTCGQDEGHPAGPALSIVNARTDLAVRATRAGMEEGMRKAAKFLRTRAAEMLGPTGEESKASNSAAFEMAKGFTEAAEEIERTCAESEPESLK